MKRQIIYIRGGETFDTYEEYIEFLKSCEIELGGTKEKRWRDTIEEKVENCELIVPSMPSPMNAKYAEWKIWFDKYVPHIRANAILIGHSLGGIFLAKYLSENPLPHKASAVFLVAAPYSDSDAPYSLADFRLPDSLARIDESVEKVYIAHSSDDPVVVYADFEKYKKALPDATLMEFADRGHFLAEQFPELVHEISLLKSEAS